MQRRSSASWTSSSLSVSRAVRGLVEEQDRRFRSSARGRDRQPLPSPPESSTPRSPTTVV